MLPAEPPVEAVRHALHERRAGQDGDGEQKEVVFEQRQAEEVRGRVAVSPEEAQEHRPAQPHVREVEEYPAREHDEEQVNVRQDVQLFKEPLEEKPLDDDENEEI